MTPAAAAATASASILLVDDDEAVRDALAAQLEGEGFTVTRCADGPSSLPLLREREFAAIISDQRMPGMSGLELLARARELQPAASRILITGVLSTDTLIGAINEGEIHRFLAKPWTRAELVATVQNAVLRHGLAKTNAALEAENARLASHLSDAETRVRRLEAARAAQGEALAETREALAAGAERATGACFQLVAQFSPLLAKRTRAVADLCRDLAAAGGFSVADAQSLLTAAWLHGAGLVGLPPAAAQRFLSAPETCTDEDWTHLREHPRRAQAIAAFLDPTLAAGEALRAHRERWDGRGYPDRLAGARIPPLARWLAVAVGFFETRLPAAAALARIEAQAGTAFDPEAVRLLQRVARGSALPAPVREVSLRELRPGMRLARSFSSAAGLLLLPEGHEVSASALERLRTADGLVDTAAQRLLVYC